MNWQKSTTARVGVGTLGGAVLAGLMGQVVMVVEAGKTRREELDAALSLLKPDQYVGLVLNKTSKSLGSDYYYGGYFDSDGT